MKLVKQELLSCQGGGIIDKIKYYLRVVHILYLMNKLFVD